MGLKFMNDEAATLHDIHRCLESLEDFARMSAMLQNEPELLETAQHPGSFCGALTPLQSAVHCRHERCVHFFIERGARIDARNERGFTALYLAIYSKNLSMVDLLLSYGANPNYQRSLTGIDQPRSWYFYLACSFGFIEIARSLALHGAVPEDFWPSGYSSAAQVSALKTHPECLLLALRHGAVADVHQLPLSLRFESVTHYSLIHNSIDGKSFHSMEMVRNVIKIWIILRHFNADFGFKNFKSNTALHRLISTYIPQDHKEILEDKFRSIMGEPLSLQSLCRITIRQKLGINCHTKIFQMNFLPIAIQNFLDFTDFESELATMCI